MVEHVLANRAYTQSSGGVKGAEKNQGIRQKDSKTTKPPEGGLR